MQGAGNREIFRPPVWHDDECIPALEDRFHNPSLAIEKLAEPEMFLESLVGVLDGGFAHLGWLIRHKRSDVKAQAGHGVGHR